jgi:hypothetical protein
MAQTRQRVEQIDYEEPVLEWECKAQLEATHQVALYIRSEHEAQASRRLSPSFDLISCTSPGRLPPGSHEANVQQSENERG